MISDFKLLPRHLKVFCIYSVFYLHLPLQKLFTCRQIDHCFPPWTSCSLWKRWQWEDRETLDLANCAWLQILLKQKKRQRLTCTKLVAAKKIWRNLQGWRKQRSLMSPGSGWGSSCFAWHLQDTLRRGAGYLLSTSAQSFWKLNCQLGKSLHIGPVFHGHAEFALCCNEIHTSFVTFFNMCLTVNGGTFISIPLHHSHTTPTSNPLKYGNGLGSADMGRGSHYWVLPTWRIIPGLVSG